MPAELLPVLVEKPLRQPIRGNVGKNVLRSTSRVQGTSSKSEELRSLGERIGVGKGGSSGGGLFRALNL